MNVNISSVLTHELNLWQPCYFIEPWLLLLHGVWSPADHICKMYICLPDAQSCACDSLSTLYMYIHTFCPIYKNGYVSDYITAHIYSWNQSQAWLGKFCGRSEVFVFFFFEGELGLRNVLILWQKAADITIPRLELNAFMIKHEPFRSRL